MSHSDLQQITDLALIEAFGFDPSEMAQAALELAAEEIGLKDWTPTEEDIEAFRRVHELEALNEEMLKTDNFRNLLVSQAADMRVVLMLIAECVC